MPDPPNDLEASKSTWGGPRPGSGVPKGYQFPRTLEKLQARELLRRRVMRRLLPLIDAQIDSALGIKHLFLRDTAGRFVLITDPTQMETALNSGEEGKAFWIYSKDPSIQAFTDLMNRTLDKPQEPVQKVEVSGEVELVARLTAARARLAQPLLSPPDPEPVGETAEEH